jgi:hypothetical protein
VKDIGSCADRGGKLRKTGYKAVLKGEMIKVKI